MTQKPDMQKIRDRIDLESYVSRRHLAERCRIWLLVALFAVVVSACGGGALSEGELATVATAEQNESQLQLSDDIALSGLLDGESGEITNLGEVVTGDRPVLLWYWAPN